MGLMTLQEIQQIFETLGLGTEEERSRFRGFSTFLEPEGRAGAAFGLDDTSLITEEDRDHAQLAPAS
ncbi:MAG TPA: hypothetical protein PLE60_10820 [Candidatus Latescibacteria bacterium]|nr:hypothetical protein [Candidatus Latescibacterota bacterium]